MCCLGLPPAAAAMLGRGHRGFTCLSPHSLLPGWLAQAGPWGSTLLWDAAGSSQDLTLELQQRHKPWLCCCCCSGCSITPGQVLTAFAAFCALSSLARALHLLQLTALPSSHCREAVLPWGCRSFLLGRSLCYPAGRTAWGGTRVTLPCTLGPASTGAPEAS